jgi:hypothetical protein
LGTTTITAAAAGYSSASVNVTVLAPQLHAFNNGPSSTVGQFLEVNGTVSVPVASASITQISLQSDSPQLLLSSDNVHWAFSITLTLPANTTTAGYYIQALGSSGNASYTASTSNFQSYTDTIFMAPSGIVIAGSTTASVSQGSEQYTISTSLLDSLDNPVTTQPLAAGPLVVSLGSTTPSAGAFPSFATIQAGTSGSSVNFTPLSPGSTTLSVTQPVGWTTPTSATSVFVTVKP